MTEQPIPQCESGDGALTPAEDLWRNELQERLAHYKRRRGRRIEGAFTMRFPFPVEEAVTTGDMEVPAPEAKTVTSLTEQPFDSEPAALVKIEEYQIESLPADNIDEPREVTTEDSDEVASLTLERPQTGEEEPAIFVDPTPRPRPKRKVIAFPRQHSVITETNYRLADPVTTEPPRILDVPEELEAIPTTPFLDGLQLDPVPPRLQNGDEHVELLVSAAPVSLRLAAAALDIALTGLGTAVFAAVAFRILGRPDITKPLVLGMAAATGVLWTAYHYLFTVYAGKTVGMMAARLHLRTFKGKTPKLRQRRSRVLAFYLSAMSLGMGLMWALVDVDSLCWHDRLSRSYLTKTE